MISVDMTLFASPRLPCLVIIVVVVSAGGCEQYEARDTGKERATDSSTTSFSRVERAEGVGRSTAEAAGTGRWGVRLFYSRALLSQVLISHANAMCRLLLHTFVRARGGLQVCARKARRDEQTAADVAAAISGVRTSLSRGPSLCVSSVNTSCSPISRAQGPRWPIGCT